MINFNRHTLGIIESSAGPSQASRLPSPSFSLLLPPEPPNFPRLIESAEPWPPALDSTSRSESNAHFRPVAAAAALPARVVLT
eukprot:g30233.t1